MLSVHIAEQITDQDRTAAYHRADLKRYRIGIATLFANPMLRRVLDRTAEAERRLREKSQSTNTPEAA